MISQPRGGCIERAVVRADSSRICSGQPSVDDAFAGGCSTMTCALVPPTPNALTPALRGAASAGTASPASERRKGYFPAGSWGSALVVHDGGITPSRTTSAALMSPLTPAATSM